MCEQWNCFSLFYQRTKNVLQLGIELAWAFDPRDVYTAERNELIQDRWPGWIILITAAYWTIWLARNCKVFDNITIPAEVVARQCKKLWSWRCTEGRISIQKETLCSAGRTDQTRRKFPWCLHVFFFISLLAGFFFLYSVTRYVFLWFADFTENL